MQIQRHIYVDCLSLFNTEFVFRICIALPISGHHLPMSLPLKRPEIAESKMRTKYIIALYMPKAQEKLHCRAANSVSVTVT